MSSDNKHLALIWILFTSTAPFEFYALIPYHPYKYLTAYITVIMLMIMVKKKFALTFDAIVLIIVAQMAYSLIAIFIHAYSIVEFTLDQDSGIYTNLFIQLIVDLIVYYYIVCQGLMRKLSVSFIWIMAIMSVFGMIVFSLGLLTNLKPISSTLIPDHREIVNFILSFTADSAVSDFGSGSLIRVAGYFDEPGAFAYYLTFALLVNKLHQYSKRMERVLVIGGICTLSLAFFISIFLYYLYFAVIERRFRVIVAIVAVVSIVLISITAIKEESDFGRALYGLTVYRIQTSDTSDDKLIEGDNRSENLVYALSAFSKAPLFGYGKNAHSNPKSEFYGKLCCNPMHPFATEGIIGTFIFFLVLIYFSFFVFARAPFDFVSLGVFIIVMANIAQRPGFQHGAFGYFVYIFLLEATKWHKNQLRRKSWSVV